MTKKNTLQLRKRSSKFSSYNDVVSAMTEVDIAEGELIAGFYEENGEDHAVLGLGGVSGTTKAFFSDGQGGGGADPEEIAKIKEAVGYYEEDDLVDLGLPSGTLWAKTNLGAEKETDLGLFFQWGDTQGYEDASEHQFSWSDYKYGTSSSLTKYNATDGLTTLQDEDDAVFVATGGKMKMPTKDQLQELINYTDHEWTAIDGVNGVKFINKNDDTKYIFIPAAGDCYDGSRSDVGSWGNVWSASRNESSADYAWRMSFYAGNAVMGGSYRCYGYSVRAVAQTQVAKPMSTKLDPVPDSTEGNLPVLTDKGTLSASETIFVKEGELIQVKDDKMYPVAHPDISTQASILPERFGNMDIKEILIPIESPTTAQDIDTESLPISAMPVMASVFCGSALAAATLNKGNESWYLNASPGAEVTWDTYNDWWLLVRYVDQDEPVYYGPTFDEIDDTDDGQPVDLGLPSGTKWMKSNVGATKPSDFGKFYQWGDTQGYDGVDEHQFSWNDYKYGSYDSLTKYNNSDGLTTLEDSDDSAAAATSGGTSMPTKAQLEELRDNTEHRWLSLANGVKGMKFWKKGTEEPADGNSYIFIPAAGYCSNGGRGDVGSWGYVWSASRNESNASDAWYMGFNAGYVGMGYGSRCLGYSVRGVVAENI